MREYVFRSEDSIGPNGERFKIYWRRRVEEVNDNACYVSAVERAVFLEGERVTGWDRIGGLLGRGTWLTKERMRACGYESKPPREIAG